MNVGRICIKISGREAGKTCVIIEKNDDNFVTIIGEVKKRKCNIKHLDPTKTVLDGDLEKEFEKLGFTLFSSKPKQETIKPKKERNAKTNKPAKKEKKETKVVKKTTKKIVNKEENN